MGFWKNILPPSLFPALNNLRRDYIGEHKKSFSGEGEDLVLSKIFSGLNKGFYIDVGAYHPKIYSNTYYFYKKGWQGINIDANPMSIKKYNKFRKTDINLNYGISDNKGQMTYYMFSEPAINTFSKEVYEQKAAMESTTFLEQRTIPTLPLGEVLDKHLPKGQKIHFLDVDVEGLDMQVLQSNNWDKYQPEVILAEDLKRNIPLAQSPIYNFLTKLDYQLVAKTYSTLIFKHASSI